MKILNKAIIAHLLSAIFFTVLIIVFTVFLTNHYISSSIRNVYQEKDFIIDLVPKIKGKLEKLYDYEGLNTTFNNINITNNGSKRKYQIILSPVNDNEKNIRVCVNKTLIRDLNKFTKKDNYYILYEGQLDTGYSALNMVGMWLDKDYNLDELNVNFKLSVKIIEE